MFCTCADAQELGFFLIGQDFVYGRKYSHNGTKCGTGKNQVCRPRCKDELDYFH